VNSSAAFAQRCTLYGLSAEDQVQAHITTLDSCSPRAARAGRNPLMKFLRYSLIIVLLSNAPLQAADGKLDVKAEDFVKTILERQIGQVVELRLGSGEKIGGKVEKVGENLVHLSQLTGAEFFEAAVDLESISAVVVRAKSK
jgi:hypothetical protein